MTRVGLMFCLGLLSACGTELTVPGPENGAAGDGATSPLESAFRRAASDYQVPAPLLRAIAWVETRGAMTPGQPSAAGSWGVMQLRDEELDEAARLAGTSPGRLKVDEAANVEAAAALLRAQFDRLAAHDASLNPHEPGDWYLAVSLKPGFESATAGYAYGAEVFRALERGFVGPTLAQEPLATGWRRHAPQVEARHDGLDYSGAAAYVQSPNYTSGRTSTEFVVIHTMEGTYSGSKSWFLNPASKASAHYLVRSSDGEITQMVAHADSAWHVQCYNGRAIGIEHEGYQANPSMWFTDVMYAESAKLTKYIADRHSIPKDRAHIIAHKEVPSSCNTNGHVDPGPGWNWTKYMQLVTGAGGGGGSTDGGTGGGTGTTGTLIGAIYTGGSTNNRVDGATVTVNGQTVTTGTDGLYQFALAAGTYTASVAKSGYGTAQVSRAVTVGAQTWGSMEINPVAPADGTLSGTVMAQDTGHALEGATVTVSGQSKLTDATGTFTFSLAAGSYALSAAKNGYVQAQQNAGIASGQTTSVTLTLTPAQGPDTTAPTITISTPVAAATLDLGVVDVKGTATDDRVALSTVSVTVNGGTGIDAPVTAGAYSAQVKLAPGRNDLKVTGKDAAGNTGSAMVTVTFNAGVKGRLFIAPDMAKPLAGAAVELRASVGGALASNTTSTSNGTFFLSAPKAPADYVITVRATGYVEESETVTVPADRQAEVIIGMTSGVEPPRDLKVAFSEPQDGASVTSDSVIVYGAVTGFAPTAVTVNGVAGELLPNGGFSATVPLVVGDNTLEAIATGAGGERVSAHLSVTRRAVVSSIHGQPAKACSVAPTELAVGLAGLVLALRRRRH